MRELSRETAVCDYLIVGYYFFSYVLEFASESKDVGGKTSQEESEGGRKNGERKTTSETEKPGKLLLWLSWSVGRFSTKRLNGELVGYIRRW